VPNRRELDADYQAKVLRKDAEELWARWQKWFPLLTNYVSDLYHRMEIYKDLVEVVKANTETLKPPVLYNWLRDNYVVAESMAIRRLLDVEERSVSLGRLLREIELRPELVTKLRYRELMREKMSQQDADASFDRIMGGPAVQIASAIATADIARLEAAEENIRKLVNKRFAHAAPFTQVAQFDVFEEIEHAIEELDQVVVKYDSLIYGGGLSTAHAAKLYWKQPLEIAWIQNTPRSEVPRYEGPAHRKL